MKTPENAGSVALILFALALGTGCRRDMQDQPKYKPLGRSRFFADGRNSRPIPAHTVAEDELENDDAPHTGWAKGNFVDTIPVPVDAKLLQKGRDHFDIFCSPCHGRTGDGYGMVRQRGLWIPANLNTARLRAAPPGYLYQVIKNGYGAMGDYGDQITLDERWAIVAYLRALQLSRNGSLSDVPADRRGQLQSEGYASESGK